MSNSEDEAVGSDALSERELTELSVALVSAHAPRGLDPEVNERLIGEALEEPLAPPSEAELAESERLRRALDGETDHPDLDLVRALAAAHREHGGDAAEASRAAGLAAQNALTRANAKSQGTIVYLTFAGVLAAAACIALFVGVQSGPTASQDESARVATPATHSPSLERSRTSEELFKKKFALGETSERIDRIASARTRELRANRFRQWGVE